MIILFLVGIMFAFLVGLGTGGGMLLVPVLIDIFGHSAVEAKSIILLLYIPISLIVSYLNIKNGYFEIEFRFFALMAVVGTIGVLLGSFLSGYMNIEGIKTSYAVFIITAGVYQLLQLIFVKKDNQ